MRKSTRQKVLKKLDEIQNLIKGGPGSGPRPGGGRNQNIHKIGKALVDSAVDEFSKAAQIFKDNPGAYQIPGALSTISHVNGEIKKVVSPARVYSPMQRARSLIHFKGFMESTRKVIHALVHNPTFVDGKTIYKTQYKPALDHINNGMNHLDNAAKHYASIRE